MPEKRSRKNTVAPYSLYEREASRLLLKLLPYASTHSALRKKAGFSPKKAEPSFGVDVTFVTRGKMKSLNKKFRGKNLSTDVLSFPAPEIFMRQGHLGDLVICAPILEAQARILGHSTKRELHVLLVHGLLHLMGYDHERSEPESLEMAKWETRILGDTGLIARSRK